MSERSRRERVRASLSGFLYYALIGLALVYCLSSFPFEQVMHVYQQY